MNKTIAAGTVSAVVIASALAFVPMAVNAQSTATQARGNGYGFQDGTGGSQQGNGQQVSLESRAKALNMTAEQLTEKLKTQTMLQVAEDQGLTNEQFQSKMREASAARWQERGLSAEEVQTRTEAQVERQADCDGTGDHQGQGGFGRGQHAE